MQPLQKTVCQFLTKRSTLLLYNLALVLLGIYPEELKTYAQAKASSRIFIASSFITAKIWMHICPSIMKGLISCVIQTITELTGLRVLMRLW